MNLEGITPGEMPATERQTLHDHSHEESENVQLIEADGSNGVSKGLGGEGSGEMLVRGRKVSVVQGKEALGIKGTAR